VAQGRLRRRGGAEAQRAATLELFYDLVFVPGTRVGKFSTSFQLSQMKMSERNPGRIKPTTRSGYEYSLNRHVLPRWGHVQLADVTYTDLQQWVTELAEALAGSTVRQIYHVMSSMLTLAVRDRRIPRNPAKDVKLPRVNKERRGYLTHEQVRMLAAAAGSNGDIIVTLAYTGLRWGELAALTVKNVDVARRRLSIVQNVSEVGGQLIWGTPKSGKARAVVFPAFLLPAIQRRITGKGSNETVFSSPNGSVLRNNNFRRRIFNPAVDEARKASPQFPRITPHDLRHTAASLAVSAGANVKAIQRMLGHASAAMTLDVYADLFDEDLNAVSHALDQDAAAHFSGWSPGPSSPTSGLN